MGLAVSVVCNELHKMTTTTFHCGVFTMEIPACDKTANLTFCVNGGVCGLRLLYILFRRFCRSTCEEKFKIDLLRRINLLRYDINLILLLILLFLKSH